MELLNIFNWSLVGVACLFMGLDIVTGFTQALYNKCVSSTKMKDGIFHKCGFLLAMLLAGLCEYAMIFVDLGFNVPVQNATCLLIIMTEIVSNIENICLLSPELANSKFPQLFENLGKNKDEK